MQNKIKILISTSHDPWFNLATEDFIFRDMDPDCQILFLWRNAPTVVIGRFQNPWKECRLDLLEQDGVNLGRRQSGGGAVYQDLGNTNFTFLSSKASFSKERNNQIIINALKEFGINAIPSGRNDLNVQALDGEKKFSGSAFKETKDRSFHHGTLLINTDLLKLSEYLNPHPKKLNSKGISSVRSRVINLSELNTFVTHESLISAIILEFKKTYRADAEIEYLDNEKLLKHEKLKNYYEFLKDWNWRFGEAPSFTHEMSEYFSWGLFDVNLNVAKAVIIDAKIYSDTLHPEIVEHLMASLKNVPYNKDAVDTKLIELENEYFMYKEYLAEFRRWFIDEIK